MANQDGNSNNEFNSFVLFTRIQKYTNKTNEITVKRIKIMRTEL